MEPPPSVIVKGPPVVPAQRQGRFSVTPFTPSVPSSPPQQFAKPAAKPPAVSPRPAIPKRPSTGSLPPAKRSRTTPAPPPVSREDPESIGGPLNVPTSGSVGILRWPYRLDRVQEPTGRTYDDDGERVYRSTERYPPEWIKEQVARKTELAQDPLYDWFKMVAGMVRSDVDNDFIEHPRAQLSAAERASTMSPFNLARQVANNAAKNILSREKILSGAIYEFAVAAGRPNQQRQRTAAEQDSAHYFALVTEFQKFLELFRHATGPGLTAVMLDAARLSAAAFYPPSYDIKEEDLTLLPYVESTAVHGTDVPAEAHGNLVVWLVRVGFLLRRSADEIGYLNRWIEQGEGVDPTEGHGDLRHNLDLMTSAMEDLIGANQEVRDLRQKLLDLNTRLLQLQSQVPDAPAEQLATQQALVDEATAQLRDARLRASREESQRVDVAAAKQLFERWRADPDLQPLFGPFSNHELLRSAYYAAEYKELSAQEDRRRREMREAGSSLAPYLAEMRDFSAQKKKALEERAYASLAKNGSIPQDVLDANNAYYQLLELVNHKAPYAEILHWDAEHNGGKIQREIELATRERAPSSLSSNATLEWLAMPENMGLIFLRPIMEAAVREAVQMIWDVCGVTNVADEHLMTHGRVRTAFARFVADHIISTRVDCPTRYESEQKAERIRKRLAMQKRKFKALAYAPDGYLHFARVQNLSGFEARAQLTAQSEAYRKDNGRYYTDLYTDQQQHQQYLTFETFGQLDRQEPLAVMNISSAGAMRLTGAQVTELENQRRQLAMF